MPAVSAAVATVFAFQRRTVELVADEVRSIPEGWLARAPSLPEVWWLNGMWVDDQMSHAELTEVCQRYRGDVTYDHLYLTEQVGGQELSAAFRAAGWRVWVEVHCVMSGVPDREVDTSAVIEPLEEESLALIEQWAREDKTLHLSPDGVSQLVEASRRTWALRGARRFGVRGPEGKLLGSTVLFSDGVVAQVEDVYVVPEARGRGFGRAMVTAAAALARQNGHRLTFIVADDEDWPKQLYAKLGFAPAARSWLVHREL
jgi:GNAT superfamily N-acetyltransferase